MLLIFSKTERNRKNPTVILGFSGFFSSWEAKMKRPTTTALILFLLLITGCGSSSISGAEQTTETDLHQGGLITGMGNWKWGTAQNAIADSIYTDYEKSDEHLLEKTTEERAGVIFMQTWDQQVSVGGYNADAEFAFDDGKVCGGVYWLTDSSEKDIPAIISKYTSVYGEPFLQKETTGWGQLTLWADDDGDVIFFSGYHSIYYLQSGSPYTAECEEMLSKYHELDLQQELGKIGNTDGI